VFGKRVQLHERGGIEHGDALGASDLQWLWPVAGIDKNEWSGNLPCLAAIERNLKRFGGGKMGLASEQVHSLHRGKTVLVAEARTLDDPLLALADGW
jgi:hypothetical protein